MEIKETKEYVTETTKRNKAIYENYKQVLKELGDLANLYPLHEIYRLTALKPLPETFLTPKYIGVIVQKKKSRQSFSQNTIRKTLKEQKNEAVYQNYLEALKEAKESGEKIYENELYRMASLKPLPQSFMSPERVGRIINNVLKNEFNLR